MKTISKLLLAVAMVAGLSACGTPLEFLNDIRVETSCLFWCSGGAE